MTKPTRGNAAPNRQLSKLQQRILIRLYFERTVGLRNRVYERVGNWSKVRLSNAIEEERKTIAQVGVAWSSKLLYDETPTKAQTAALSRSLHRLEARGLIVLLSNSAKASHTLSHTTHVKFTETGKETASDLYWDWKDSISANEE